MYAVTIKISEMGTIYIPEDYDPNDPNTGEPHSSLTGHMWYSLSNNSIATGSYGFAPITSGEWRGDGTV